VTPRRLWFVAGALVLFAWTACVDLALQGRPGGRGVTRVAGLASSGSPDAASSRSPGAASSGSARMAAASLDVRPRAGPGLATAVASPRSTPGSRAANNATDPAAAEPTAVDDSALTWLVRRWCAAYLRWGSDPTPGAAAVLRSLSTSALYAALVARPPTSPATAVPAETVSSLQTFAGVTGFTAIVDVRGDGVDVALALAIARTPAGLRVSQLDL
jgi:hypothetical protein